MPIHHFNFSSWFFTFIWKSLLTYILQSFSHLQNDKCENSLSLPIFLGYLGMLYDVWKFCVYKSSKHFCANSPSWYQSGNLHATIGKHLVWVQVCNASRNRWEKALRKTILILTMSIAVLPWFKIFGYFKWHLHLIFSTEDFYPDSCLGNTVYVVE